MSDGASSDEATFRPTPVAPQEAYAWASHCLTFAMSEPNPAMMSAKTEIAMSWIALAESMITAESIQEEAQDD